MRNFEYLITKKISSTPLAVFRILFGAMLIYAQIWSVSKGDLGQRYFNPNFFFKYYGFEWLPYVGDTGIYVCYSLWLIGATGIFLGAFYRLSVLLFVLSFGYLQLLDATNYINHYYAILIFACFLLFLPANCSYSVDAHRKPFLRLTYIPFLYILIFRFQIAIVYVFAAVAKCNSDWLQAAMPLKIWLLQQADFPVIGFLFKYHATHIVLSWLAFLFDLTIIVWLSWRPTRKAAYTAVVLFHVATGMLFNIGLFPLLMIVSTLLFFPPQSFDTFIGNHKSNLDKASFLQISPILKGILAFHFVVQILLPLRHHILYEDNLLWTENGYRFSWRVMLVEKEGTASFTVKDPATNRIWQVTNSEFLTAFQEKRMAVRPNHIIQFAQHLGQEYRQEYAIKHPEVYADVYVSLNGRTSQRLINNRINLFNYAYDEDKYPLILPLVE